MHRLYKKYKRDTLLQCSSKENILVPQTPSELALAYIFLTTGACAAFFMLCLERLRVPEKTRSNKL